MALKRSVGIGAITICVTLAGCRDDGCNGQKRDTSGCSSSGHGGGAFGTARSGSSEGTSSVTRGGFGGSGSAGGGE